MTHPWELTDTVTTLTDIMTVSRPRPGDVVVARVEIATQALSGFRLVQAPAAPLVLDASRESDEQLHALSDRLADAARDLGSSTMPEGARWSVPTGILVTVVCRTGRTGLGLALRQPLHGRVQRRHLRDDAPRLDLAGRARGLASRA